MLCPCLSSTVVSLWLLIACTYNTLTKKKVCIFVQIVLQHFLILHSAMSSFWGTAQYKSYHYYYKCTSTPKFALQTTLLLSQFLEDWGIYNKRKIPKMDVGVTRSFKTQAVCGHAKESMAVTEDIVRADQVHAQTFSCPECRRWQWRSVSSLSAPFSSFHPCQEQIVTSG